MVTWLKNDNILLPFSSSTFFKKKKQTPSLTLFCFLWPNSTLLGSGSIFAYIFQLDKVSTWRFRNIFCLPSKSLFLCCKFLYFFIHWTKEFSEWMEGCPKCEWLGFLFLFFSQKWICPDKQYLKCVITPFCDWIMEGILQIDTNITYKDYSRPLWFFGLGSLPTLTETYGVACRGTVEPQVFPEFPHATVSKQQQ